MVDFSRLFFGLVLEVNWPTEIVDQIFIFAQLWKLIDQPKSVGHNRPKSVDWLYQPIDRHELIGIC